MFRRSDDPDQDDASCCNRAGGVAHEEIAHEWQLMGDADAGGEEHDCAVGVEGLRAAVGTFDEGGEGDAVVGGRECFPVEM